MARHTAARSGDDSERPARVTLVQRVYPHYRQGIFRALARCPELDFRLLHGAESVHGIENVQDELVPRLVGPTATVGWGRFRFWRMPHFIQHARHGDYDVLIFTNDFSCMSLWPALRAARRRAKALVLFTIGFAQRPQALRDRMRIRLAHRVDSIVLYNFRNRDRYVEAGVPANKIFVAPNAIDTDAITAAEATMTEEALAEFRRQHALTPGRTLIHAGRLVERKRLDLLLQATARLRDEFPNLRVVLIGDGELRAEWQKLAGDLGVAEQVIWPGHVVAHEQLCYWFHAADVCVAPAQQGLIANLCHSYGVPLVVSDDPLHQGPEIQVFEEGRTGLTYRFPDVDDLAAKLRELLRNDTQRKAMGTAARRRLFENFTLERQLQGFVDGIQFALAQRRATTASLPS